VLTTQTRPVLGMNSHDTEIEIRCGLVKRQLADAGRRLVLAESCTAGLIAASLGRIPGISDVLCGSLVTYRDATKTNWLGVPESVLGKHTAVSESVAGLMVTGALVATPEADLAASVTGHLGPDAPASQDGLIYVGIAERSSDTGEICVAPIRQCRLSHRDRLPRQREAVLYVLERLLEILSVER
jgi:PncC family amidohydrolase